ncbi:MAG: HEAT repeat domain-containing protein, partial [Anaerolineales bacterium]
MTSSRLKTGSLDEQKAWDRYFEYLIKALHDPDATARARAARILGDNREPNAAEALRLAMMDDPDLAVRQAAAVALGRIGVVEPLIDAVAMPDARVRLIAIQALGQIGDPRGIKPLIVALRDSS